MSTTALIEKTTGRVLNAVDSPSGNLPVVFDVATQELKTITAEEFAGACDQTLTYYNYATEELEPTAVRRLVLNTPGPFPTGTINLVFQQQDMAGAIIAVPATFTININDQQQEVLVEDGSLEIELSCPESVALRLLITAPRHEPFSGEVQVIET